MTAVARFRSPIGPILVEATDRGVCGLAIGGGAAPSPPISMAEKRNVEAALAALRDYFRGRPPELPQLDLAGSPFDRKVWAALLELPWGQTCTYGALAARLGIPGAARAVGAANGRNRVAILIPCHRVVAAHGLGGYAGGLERKRWLLAHEAAYAPALRGPVEA